MKHLKPYNESLRDKMTPKDLSPDDKYAHENFDKIKSISGESTQMKKINNVYYLLSHSHGFLVTYCDPKTYKGDEEIGYQQDHIVKIKKGWTLYINIHGINRNYDNKYYITNSDNLNDILKKVIERCYSDVDALIKEKEKKKEELESDINHLKEIKKLKETL